MWFILKWLQTLLLLHRFSHGYNVVVAALKPEVNSIAPIKASNRARGLLTAISPPQRDLYLLGCKVEESLPAL